ncbi:hypothetical protein [Methylobacterium mesophilicum]
MKMILLFLVCLGSSEAMADTRAEVLARIDHMERRGAACQAAAKSLRAQNECIIKDLEALASEWGATMATFRKDLEAEPNAVEAELKFELSQNLWLTYREQLCEVSAATTADPEYARLLMMLCQFKTCLARMRELYNWSN